MTGLDGDLATAFGPVLGLDDLGERSWLVLPAQAGL
jgi:hypothetical protein